jgi:hypothetical protein
VSVSGGESLASACVSPPLVTADKALRGFSYFRHKGGGGVLALPDEARTSIPIHWTTRLLLRRCPKKATAGTGGCVRASQSINQDAATSSAVYERKATKKKLSRSIDPNTASYYLIAPTTILSACTYVYMYRSYAHPIQSNPIQSHAFTPPTTIASTPPSPSLRPHSAKWARGVRLPTSISRRRARMDSGRRS